MATAKNIPVKDCSHGTMTMVYVDLKDKTTLGQFAFGGDCLDNPNSHYEALKTRKLKGTKLDNNGHECAKYHVLCPAKGTCPFHK